MKFWLSSLFILRWCCIIVVAEKPCRPHIVLMIADDLGWNDVSFHGSKQIPTPNIDAIARDGIILNQYYVQPICSPSRSSLVTGKHVIQLGFQHSVIHHSQPWGLPLKEKIMPQYLKELDYSTHAVGKWHLGFFKKEYLPTRRGFDSFFGYYNGLNDYFTYETIDIDTYDKGLDLHNNEENVWHYNGTYASDLYTAKAKKIIFEHDRNKPLFLYFSQQAPHSGNFDTEPLQAPKKYVEPMVGIHDEKRKTFAGMVSSLDHSVGEIFEALERTGMLDNTIFIFTTDNGGAPQGADGTSGSNWPFKGGKYTLWEGGMRGVSFIWSSFLRRRSRIYNGLMHISDWLPTILSAAGGQEGKDMLPKDIFGIDQWSSIVYDVPSSRQELLLNIDNLQNAEGIRRERYKLVKGAYKDGKFDKWFDREGKIFNITYSFRPPFHEILYFQNYLRFLRLSKAANILWRKYRRDPDLAISCLTPTCKEELEIACGVPPDVSNCDAASNFCLFDIIRDPCEFHNIAEKFPNVVDELKEAINKYRDIFVPAVNHTIDPAANPKLHGNVWIPWK